MKYDFPFKEKFYIYKISNIINNKLYIGRTKNPAYRFRQYLSISLNTGKSLRVQKIHLIINEFGHENFKFEVFEECDNCRLSCARESFWINFYHSDEDGYGYNKNNSLEFHNSKCSIENKKIINKHLSNEARKKMSENFLGCKNPFYGKNHSDETKKIIGKSSRKRMLGENNPHAKLTIEIVVKIRQDWLTGIYTKVQLSKKYNVTAATIGNIISGKTWK